MKLYLIGPMTGYHNDNRETFNAVARRLRGAGLEVVNPAELDDGLNVPGRTDCYARDLPHLAACDGAVVLPGWRLSIGGSMEAVIFRTLERPVFVWPTMRQIPVEELPFISHPVDPVPEVLKTAT